MKRFFVDTFYWTALTNTGDDWHRRVLELTVKLHSTRLVTTEEILL